MAATKKLFMDIREKEYYEDRKQVIESEENNHIKAKSCKTKISIKK